MLNGKKGYSRYRDSGGFDFCHGACYGGRYLVPRSIRTTDVKHGSTHTSKSTPESRKMGEGKERTSGAWTYHVP